MAIYAAIWEFQVRPGHERDFERSYRPDGDWARLFRRAPGYIESRLLKDCAAPGRYVTIDRWQSEESFRAFRAQLAQAYEELDRHCEAFTLRENAIGSFSEST